MITKLNPASSMLLMLGFASSLFYSIIWFVLPLVVADQSVFGWMSLGLGVFDFGVVFLGFLLGRLADHGNKRMLVFFGLLLFSVSAMFLGFHLNWFFLLFGFLATAGDEISSISLWSWLHGLDHEHAHDGAVAGVITLFSDFGWAIGPILAGLLYPMIGASWTIAVGALAICFTWLFYEMFQKKHHPVCLPSVPDKPHVFRHCR